MEQKEKGISHIIKSGQINKLAVTRLTDHGLVLRNHNGDQEVLLPNAYVQDEMKELGKGVEVFVYHDSEERLVATTERPLVMAGEFGYLEVVAVEAYGAFIDWGFGKDLLVPLSHQKSHFRIGEKYIIRVAIDEQTGRVYGSQRIGKWLEPPRGLVPSQKVDALVIARTPMGHKLIIENRYEAMIYDNEIFEPIIIGKHISVYIKKVRKDGKIDCSIHPIGVQARKSDGTRKILNVLEQAGGSLSVTTKSSPEKIKKIFGMSKKSFKATTNELAIQGKVEFRDGYMVMVGK